MKLRNLIAIGFLWIVTFACSQPPPATAPVDPPRTEPEKLVKPEMNEKENATNADADVIFVRAMLSKTGTWTFHVTVAHPDTGWEDYTDGWDVVLPDGMIVKPDPNTPFTRLLLHPHVEEQPFTRSQSNIQIPVDVYEVTVRAHDLINGFGGKEIKLDLMKSFDGNYEIIRP